MTARIESRTQAHIALLIVPSFTPRTLGQRNPRLRTHHPSCSDSNSCTTARRRSSPPGAQGKGSRPGSTRRNFDVVTFYHTFRLLSRAYRPPGAAANKARLRPKSAFQQHMVPDSRRQWAMGANRITTFEHHRSWDVPPFSSSTEAARSRSPSRTRRTLPPYLTMRASASSSSKGNSSPAKSRTSLTISAPFSAGL